MDLISAVVPQPLCRVRLRPIRIWHKICGEVNQFVGGNMPKKDQWGRQPLAWIRGDGSPDASSVIRQISLPHRDGGRQRETGPWTDAFPFHGPE